MEAASEKPKRGRPRTVRHFVDSMRFLWPEFTTDRSHANRYYAVHAAGVLEITENWEAWPWLCPHKERWHWDLLAALGRVKNDVALRIFAERVCELRRPVKESIRLVRQWERRRQSISATAIARDKVPTEIDQWIEDVARTASMTL